jgi:hypothetical protein
MSDGKTSENDGSNTGLRGGRTAAWYRPWLRPKRLALVVIGLFVLAQIVPVWLLQTNPAVAGQPTWDSARTATLVRDACFDCHSNATTWPWYSHVAPVSWLVTYDVVRGRSHLNFSEWKSGIGYGGRSPAELADRAARAVTSGDMPPSYYTLMHPRASLSSAERQELAAGLISSLK